MSVGVNGGTSLVAFSAAESTRFSARNFEKTGEHLNDPSRFHEAYE